MTLVLLSTIALAGAPETSTWNGGGSAGEAEAPAQPIINGDPATEEDYPMAGGLIFDGTLNIPGLGTYDARMFLCSSTLIAPDTVLAAAHCFDENALTYGFGSVENETFYWSRQADLTAHDGSTIAPLPEDAIAAVEYHFHENFDLFALGTGITINDDIGLIFLEEPVTDVPFAYVPQSAEEDEQLVEGVEVTIVGWGQQEATEFWEVPPPGSFAEKMMGVSPVGEVGTHEFHIGPAESDARNCHGDSGGPAFQYIDTPHAEAMRIVGVTSHSYDTSDCWETGGVDTRVGAYVDWIDAVMRDGCDRGVRSWCEQEGLPDIELATEPGDTDTDTDTDSDTGPVADTDPPAGDTGETGIELSEEPKGGCSTPALPLSALGWLAGAGLLARRRR